MPSPHAPSCGEKGTIRGHHRARSPGPLALHGVQMGLWSLGAGTTSRQLGGALSATKPPHAPPGLAPGTSSPAQCYALPRADLVSYEQPPHVKSQGVKCHVQKPRWGPNAVTDSTAGSNFQKEMIFRFVPPRTPGKLAVTTTLGALGCVFPPALGPCAPGCVPSPSPACTHVLDRGSWTMWVVQARVLLAASTPAILPSPILHLAPPSLCSPWEQTPEAACPRGTPFTPQPPEG